MDYRLKRNLKLHAKTTVTLASIAAYIGTAAYNAETWGLYLVAGPPILAGMAIIYLMIFEAYEDGS